MSRTARQRRQRLGGALRSLAAVALLVIPGLVACAQNGGLNSILTALDEGGAFPIPADARGELERFKSVYVAYASEPARQPYQHFNDAFRRVRVTYVEPVPDAVLIDATIAGVEELEGEIGGFAPKTVVEAGLASMLASLDPHSSYLNAEELRESKVSTKGQFGGLGIEITLEDDVVTVVAPIEGTPAEAAGLLSGDAITHVDGRDIRGAGLTNAVNLMRGEPGSAVVITVVRGGGDAFDVEIVRDIIRVRSVRWRAEGNVGYIRVTRFTERVEPGIVRAMNDLRDQIGGDIAGIVLDLRNNPGGLLDQSLILADSFLEDGTIVSIKGRGGHGSRQHTASPGDMAAGLPLVVLINGGAASASEIVAGALQENSRAVIMGSRSFGKGSVQTITPLPIEGALRLTTALYFSPDGHSIQGNGVYPDIVLNVPAPEEQADLMREVDLPNALARTEQAWRKGVPEVNAEHCAVAGAETTLTRAGEPDHELNCALRYLATGSLEGFVAAVGGIPQS